MEALGHVVIGPDPRIGIGHAVTALDVSGLGLLPVTAPAVSVRVPLLVGRGGRDRSRSHASSSRSFDRSRSLERLSASSSRSREDGAARRARRGIQEGVEAVASQPAVVPGGSGDVTPVAGGTSMTALPSAMKELARFFLNLSGSSSLGASGDSAGVTAFRSGVGGSLRVPLRPLLERPRFVVRRRRLRELAFCLMCRMLFLACLGSVGVG